MGNIITFIRHALVELLDTVRSFQQIEKRVGVEPGIPVPNPSRSFWMFPPSPIASHSSELPQHADIVVIGSGITGAAVARTLLDIAHAQGKLPVLLMLEARDACSGATGRNGGHISPGLYQDFEILRREHGVSAAHKIINFRLAHRHEMGRVAEEEGILEQSQWRQVEAVEAFFSRELFAKAKASLNAYRQALPSEADRHGVYESQETSQKYSLAADVVGCITSSAGAIHPYQFVTGILSNLLKRYPQNFFLCTNTPCTSIVGPSASEQQYTVVTPKGPVKTPHVVHATNAWSSHLLTPMRGKIVPLRGYVTAQRPGQSIPPETVQRSFTFRETPVGYDYLTQLPSGEREFILGGAFTLEGQEGFQAIAATDDSVYSKRVMAHLSGALPRYYGEDNWGCEGQPPQGDTSEWYKGRVKAAWSGIMGMSADLLPWVGRLSPSISGRPVPSNQSLPHGDGTVIPTAPGEWIAAGYTGEGMVHAWLSGKALAGMILGKEREENLADWFPDDMRVSAARWKRANPAALLDHFFS